MEKISHIVPGSSRVTSVDIKNERPVRASAPSFGAPVSESVNRGPVKHAVDEAGKAFNEVYGPDAKVAKEAEIARRMTEEFFVNQGQHHRLAAKAPATEIQTAIQDVQEEQETQPEEAVESPPTMQKSMNAKGNFSVRV